jgi:methylamine---glutamate N-methyltransferase subunit C
MATDPRELPAPERLQEEAHATFDRQVLDYVQRASATGLYEIRGLGAKRRLPHFDDLTFLGASLSRYALEGYREKCTTKTVLGTRFASKPIELDIPITVAGMSFGALSANVKEALGRAASALGTSTTTGDGGMTNEERASSKTLIYQCLPSRYGFNPDDLRRADAIEVVIGQGAKPGGGGMLLGQKISPRVARMRTLPEGVDQRSACRHPDWTGPDDLAIKIKELREITDWEKPIYVKVGATRVYHDVKLAVHAGADVVVVDGMQGGTAATQWAFIEHVGIPTLAAVRLAVAALEDMNMKDTVQLIVSGGIRTGADVAKALALGADAVAIGQGVLVALGCNADTYVRDGVHHSAIEDYRKLRTVPGSCHHCHTGRCPTGVTTQDPLLEQRLEPAVGATRVQNYFKTMNMELTMLARACGKQNVHHLEREDLVALTVEAAAMAGVPLAGTSWIPGDGAGEPRG